MNPISNPGPLWAKGKGLGLSRICHGWIWWSAWQMRLSAFSDPKWRPTWKGGSGFDWWV